MMTGLFPSSLFTIHKGKSGGRGLSPRLWANINNAALSADGLQNGYFQSDDFTCLANTTAVAANVGRYASDGGGLLSYEDTGCAISQLATEVGGVMHIVTPATDNLEAWIQPGSLTSVFGKVSNTAGADKLLIFETRFRVGQITNTYDVFLGMSEEGCAVADTVADAGTLVSKDLLGFWILEGAGSTLAFGYRKAGQALVVLATFGSALVASTWYKAGFVYNPAEVPARRIKFYIDNVEQAAMVTATNIAAATFPNGEELNFLAGIKNGTASINSVDVDWYSMFQAG